VHSEQLPIPHTRILCRLARVRRPVAPSDVPRYYTYLHGRAEGLSRIEHHDMSRELRAPVQVMIERGGTQSSYGLNRILLFALRHLRWRRRRHDA